MILFMKAHVSGYTRSDGVFVKPHEDKRPAAHDDGLHRNCLGGLEPIAQVSGIGGMYGQYKQYMIHSMSEKVRGRVWPTIEDAERALVDEGWIVSGRSKDGYNKPKLHMEHAATAAAVRDIQVRQEAKWRGAKPVYVRYGKPPATGYSRNHADGSLEIGVSVYRGEALKSGEARPLPKNNQEAVGALNFEYLGVPLYIVTGDLVGTGSDGEPLLRNVKVVRKSK